MNAATIHPSIEIMDTTLRDGEQTSGVSFATNEKVSIARLLLEDVQVDRIEVASARVSQGELEAVTRIIQWAKSRGYLSRVEVLGFVDGHITVDWMKQTGATVLNLLCKGSLKHVTEQLHRTPEQHLAESIDVIRYAEQNNIQVNVYLEDWSNGIQHSPDYVHFMIQGLSQWPVKRFMLPDTLGILNPYQTGIYCKEMVDRYPDLHFDFHAHNDYDFAVANSFIAAMSGFRGIHATVNGLGERAGNPSLSSIMAMLTDHLQATLHTKEDHITHVSKIVESYSGIRIPSNKPIIGDNVFTQCAGIHADGDNKSNLYYNDLLPERFGRERSYALGKMSGKANIKKNLEALGIELDEASMKLLTQHIIELGDKKELVSMEDLPYIISDLFHNEQIDEKIKVLNYSLSVAQGLKPVATIKIDIKGAVYQRTAVGDGQYDAFMKALWQIYDSLKLSHPVLVDYEVTIPPGGSTDAFVQTVITWRYKNKTFKTRALDPDQTEAAIKATLKMLNILDSM